MRFFIFLLISQFIISNILGQAASYQKSFDKADESFEIGDYEKALSIIYKLKEKTSSKLGATNNFTAQALIYEAKYYIGFGELVKVINTLEKGVAMSLESNGENTIEYGYALLEATGIMIDYGHFRLAQEYHDKASETLTNAGAMVENIQAKLNVQKAQILAGKGFYSEAIKLVDEQEDYYLNRSLNATGKKKEIDEIEAEYGEIMIVKANSYRKMGDFIKADELFRQNLLWVEKNLKKTHYLWGKNAFLNAKLLEENGLSIEGQRKLYEEAYLLAERKYAPSHNTVMKIRAELMRAYYADDKKSKLKLLRTDFKNSLRGFDKTSIYLLEDEKMNMEFDLADAEISQIENAVNLLFNLESLPAYHQERIELLEFAKKIGLLSGKHKNTESYEKEILKIKAELIGEDAPDYHLSKIRLANYYMDYEDDLDLVKDIYENSFDNLVKKEITKGHKDYLDMMNHLAKYYEEIDNFERSAQFLDEALLVSREKYDNQDPAYGKELKQIADLQIKIGDYESAEKNIDEAIEIMLQSDIAEAPAILSSSCITKAKLLSIKGEYDEAEKLIYESEKLRYEVLSLETRSISLDEDLASLYLNLGRYTEAQDLLNASIQEKEINFGYRSRKLNNPLVLSSKLKLIQGDYTDAENQARRANTNAIGVYGEKSSKIVPSYLQLADLYTTIGDYDKAEQILKNCIEIQKETFGNEHVDVAKTISRLALVNFYKGRPVFEVQSLFQEAEKIIGKKLGSNNPTYAEILKNLAIINTASKNYNLAFSYINDAEKIWAAKIGKRNNINAAIAKVIKGDIYYHQNNYNEAEKFYENAKKQYEKVFNESHPEYVKVLSKLGKTYFMQERFKDSQNELEIVLSNYKNFIKDYFPALSEREKAKFWNTIKEDYEFYNTLIISRNRTEKYIGELFNNALLTKALLLNSSIKVRRSIMNSNDLKLIELYEKWLENKELLTAALSMSVTDLEQNGINTQVLAGEVEQLEKELNVKSEAFSESSDNKSITWESVKSTLKENEVAIEMVRFRHFDHSFTDSVLYALLYVDGGKKAEPKMILLENGEELENRFLNTYRNSIKYKIKDRFSYDKFWKPINDAIGTVTAIYLSPDGVYNQINLEAIPTPEGSYVLDNSNIVLVSNTKDLYLNKIRTRTLSEEKNASVFGNPKFYTSTKPGEPLPESGITRSSAEVISSLPGTLKELEELRDLLGTKGWKVNTFNDTEATEKAIKEIDNPRIFHVATHGFFQPAPKATTLNTSEYNENAMFDNPLLKTGLLFTGAGDILNSTKFNYNVEDGILTAYEAMNLDLDGTDLVVLSACETGLGELQAGEGVYGLQRSFLVAGARTIVMSLFKVSDEATQQLMIKFYKKWTETGNKRQAFIDAKKEIRNEFRDPIYWGPFVMIGLD